MQCTKVHDQKGAQEENTRRKKYCKNAERFLLILGLVYCIYITSQNRMLAFARHQADLVNLALKTHADAVLPLNKRDTVECDFVLMIGCCE